MSKYDGSRGPPHIAGMCSLKVDNLTYRTTSEDLERYFKKFGDVGDIYIPRDRDSHESRGFAFVRFFEEADADDAMDSMDGKVIDGREIRVAMARYGRPTNPYDPKKQGYGNNRRDGGRSGGYNRDRGHRNDFRDRRRSPRRRRSYSRSRSRSRERNHRRSRSRSRSRSPRRHQRSRSPRRRSRSPRRASRSPHKSSRSPRKSSRSPRKSSRSPKRYSRSPRKSSRSPSRKSRSASPRKSSEKENSRSRSRSRSMSRHSNLDDQE